MQKTIALPVKEYRRLRRIERQYETVRRTFAFADARELESPPVKDAETILLALKKSGHYNDAFLKSIARGIRESKTFTSL